MPILLMGEKIIIYKTLTVNIASQKKDVVVVVTFSFTFVFVADVD